MILRSCMSCRGVQRLPLLVVMLFGLAEASVQICTAGDYLTARGVCLACPQGRLSVPGATSINQCLCQPAEEVVATAPFPGLTQDATVSQTDLDMWAAEGVVSWVLGALGESCTDVCADNNFLCSDNLDSNVFQIISIDYMSAMVTVSDPSKSCGVSFEFPGYDWIPATNAASNCMLPPSTATALYKCGAVSSSAARMCACTAPAPIDPCPEVCGNSSWSVNGAVPCIPCFFGSTPHGARNEANCTCDTNTYTVKPEFTPDMSSIIPVVPTSVLDVWNANGVKMWTWGKMNANCDETCAAQNMTCTAPVHEDVLRVFTADIMKNMMTILSNNEHHCNNNFITQDSMTPYTAMTTCYFPNHVAGTNVGTFSCADKAILYKRLCPCFLDPNRYRCEACSDNSYVDHPGECPQMTFPPAAAPAPPPAAAPAPPPAGLQSATVAPAIASSSTDSSANQTIFAVLILMGVVFGLLWYKSQEAREEQIEPEHVSRGLLTPSRA